MKDHTNLGKGGQVIHPKPIYDATFDDLLEDVRNQVMLKLERDGVSFTQN